MSQMISETQARRILNSMKAYRAATIVEGTGWALVILAPLAGIAIAVSDGQGNSATVSSSTSDVLLGIIVGITGLIYASAIIMVAAYIKSRVSDDSIISLDDDN